MDSLESTLYVFLPQGAPERNQRGHQKTIGAHKLSTQSQDNDINYNLEFQEILIHFLEVFWPIYSLVQGKNITAHKKIKLTQT